MALKPWERYAQAAQGSASGGQEIMISGPDPFKQAEQGRAAEDQELQRAANARAEAQLALSRDAAARSAETSAREAQNSRMGTESERTAGFLTGRIVDAVGRMTGAVNKDRDAQRPSVGVELVRGISDTAANYVTDSERQQVRAAEMDILDAALTLGTGAAYTKEQLEGYRESYFPKLGDSDETLASKRTALRSLMQNAVTKAGKAAPDIERAIAALDALDKPVAAAVDPDAKSEYGYDEEAGGLFGRTSDDSPVPPGTTPGGGPNSGERGGVMDLARQGVTLGLADEAQGIGGYLSAFITGDDPQAAYVRDRDAARRRVAEARQDSPILGTGLELLAGGGATRIAGAAGNALRSVVGQGATLGGIGGYGYGEGNGSVTNALAGAVGGAALGGALYGVGRGVGALASRRQGPSPTAEQLALVQAGERQGVPMRQPDVRPELRNQMANAETTQTAGPIIRDARAADVERIEQRVAEVGGSGAVADSFTLGQSVQGAGTRYIARTRQQASRLYDRARTEANGATVQPTEAVAAIDNNIAELRAAGENSNAGQIAYLEGLKADLSRPLTIEAVQNLRTNMRGQLSEKGLTGTDAERRVGQVIDAANADLVRELPQGASQALRSADAFYRERQTFINDTLKQFMGSRGAPLQAEAAAQRLMAMTKGERGNETRFANMWKELEPDEQADIAATVAESLGRKRNGEFSAATLVGSLDPRKGINERTARLIFGEEGAAALRDLRAIAKAKSDTQASLNNSRTGTAVNAASGGLKNMMLGAFGLSQGGIGGAVALPIAGRMIASLGEKRAARMLLNPDFTKWLRNAPNSSNPRVIDRYFSRLAGMNSIAANDNQAFQAALRDAASRSPGAAAANEERD